MRSRLRGRGRRASLSLVTWSTFLVVAMLASPARAVVLEYTGSWFNQTFMSTGPAAATIESNPPAVSFTLDLDGSVFGGTNPTPLTLTGTQNPDMSVTFNPVVGHPTYGDVTGSLSATGAITAAGTNIPGGVISGVTLTGQFTQPAIDMNYVVTFAQGGSANGIIDLNLIPEPSSAVAATSFALLVMRRRRRHARCD